MELTVVAYGGGVKSEGEGEEEVKYKECMRNHAATIGGHAFDGCGEFMPCEEETLKCAACGCHRNFHRKEGYPRNFPLVLFDRMTPTTVRSAVPLSYRAGSETPPTSPQRYVFVEKETMGRKRHRTRFTEEQKEKMQAFAERVGWKIQRHDDVELQEFCQEIGVNRHVLKVWMHNNKNSLGGGGKAKRHRPTVTTGNLEPISV